MDIRKKDERKLLEIEKGRKWEKNDGQGKKGRESERQTVHQCESCASSGLVLVLVWSWFNL